MRSLLSSGLPLALACALFACSSSSSNGPVGDAGKDGTEPSMDASMDTTPDVGVTDSAPVGPPACRSGCPTATPSCCENADSPNFGLCYVMTNTAFCANEGGAP